MVSELLVKCEPRRILSSSKFTEANEKTFSAPRQIWKKVSENLRRAEAVRSFKS